MKWITLIVLCLGQVACVSTGKQSALKTDAVYAEPGGQPLDMSLFQPSGPAQTLRPAVLLIHGGGWRHGSRRQENWYGRAFAEHGYVAMSISYRLMEKYPFPYCVYDSKAAVRWLRLHAEEYHIDPNRIAVLGNSAGGHLATMLATTPNQAEFEGGENPGPSSEVQAAVSLYGATDLTYFREPHKLIRFAGATPKYMSRFVGASRPDGQDPWRVASPITHASKTTAPILFIHGTRDHIVPFAQSQAFYDRLRMLGVPTELVPVKGRDHAFDNFRPRERARVFEDMLSFLDRYMPALAGSQQQQKAAR